MISAGEGEGLFRRRTKAAALDRFEITKNLVEAGPSSARCGSPTSFEVAEHPAAGTSPLRRTPVRFIASTLLLAMFFPWLTPLRAAEPAQPKPKISVSGYGFFGNRNLKNTLRLLEPPGRERTHYDANYIEDAVLILMSRVQRDGYLHPEIDAKITFDNGEVVTYHWKEAIEDPLPRPLEARRVDFEVSKGVRYFYDHIAFEGLESIREREARGYFIERGALLPLKGNRIYTPSQHEGGVSSLAEALVRLGYTNAKVETASLLDDPETGRVRAIIQVVEGPRSLVRSIRHEVFYENRTQPEDISLVETNRPYSPLWEQDYRQSIRTNLFRRGYPDAELQMSVLNREPDEDELLLDMLARVETGPQITVGSVRFEGHERTKDSVLRRRVRIRPGALLDRMQADQGRQRLARLGSFRSVDLRYDPVDETTRDVIYELEEGRQIDVSLLFGYGSYEMLRIGVELEQYNIFGRAHYARLRAVQSLRSSSAEFLYTMPELVGEDLDVFINAFGLLREEVNFTRQEFGGGAGVRKFSTALQSDVSLQYNHSLLTATRGEVDPRDGLDRARVGALILDVRHDQRDNPLYPRTGYKIFSSVEVASQFLAGEVDFQRLEFLGSYHYPLDEGRWLHFGVAHGVVFTVDGPDRDLPFNRRFFPGGETSIRGYQQGRASPRNELGQLVGAETYTFGTVEFEQALTPTWSVVGFFDAIGFARRVGDYPMDEELFSAGGGLRWKTPIGPVRIEYGHNLNRRAQDASGTLHFALGFPF
jgi:outer membrane protein insertion porin family